MENRISELEADVTVKERIKLEKEEEAKIFTGIVKELEQKKNQDTSSLTTNSKVNSGKKSESRKNRKNSDTQNYKIPEFPVKTITDDNHLDNNFADESRDITFYDFPWMKYI